MSSVNSNPAEVPAQSHEPIEFKQVACVICGSKEGLDAGAVTWRQDTLKYSLCCNCGLKFMNPRPTTQWYHRFYATQFWDGRLENKNWARGRIHWLPWQWHRRGLKGRLEKQKRRVQELMPMIAAHTDLNAQSNILDIGCAFGVVLDAFAEKWGCGIYGVEPGKVARAHAEQHNNVTFVGEVADDLITLEGYDGFFDLIMFSNVLENVVHPQPVLEAARRLLKPGGLVYVNSPNFYYYDAMNPYHPYVFSPESLNELLARTGLQVTASEYEEPASKRTTPLKLKRFSRERFVATLARRGDKEGVLQTPVNVAAIAEDQKASLALYAEARKARKRTPRGLLKAIVNIK